MTFSEAERDHQRARELRTKEDGSQQKRAKRAAKAQKKSDKKAAKRAAKRLKRDKKKRVRDEVAVGEARRVIAAHVERTASLWQRAIDCPWKASCVRSGTHAFTSVEACQLFGEVLTEVLPAPENLPTTTALSSDLTAT